jgi:hypothetical protein
MSIREISRRTGLARNTVKKHLRSEESEPSYKRRATPSKLDPYAEKLATWLVIEATKSRKQRRTLRQIHTLSPKRRKPRTYPHREHPSAHKECGSIFDGKLGSDFSGIQHQLRKVLKGQIDRDHAGVFLKDHSQYAARRRLPKNRTLQEVGASTSSNRRMRWTGVRGTM